jgi:hypothetical protein
VSLFKRSRGADEVTLGGRCCCSRHWGQCRVTCGWIGGGSLRLGGGLLSHSTDEVSRELFEGMYEREADEAVPGGVARGAGPHRQQPDGVESC